MFDAIGYAVDDEYFDLVNLGLIKISKVLGNKKSNPQESIKIKNNKQAYDKVN